MKWTKPMLNEYIRKPFEAGLSGKEISQKLGLSDAMVSVLKHRCCPDIRRPKIVPPPTCEFTYAWAEWALEARQRGYYWKEIAEASYIETATAQQRLGRYLNGNVSFLR